jgi:hypothetical protein
MILGPAFRYCLTSNDLKKVGIKRFNAAKWKLNPGKWLLDHSVELPLDVHCVVVAEDSVAKVLVCSCLIPDEKDGNKWKRIGLCHWDGLAWQVAKYVGRKPREMTFTVIGMEKVGQNKNELLASHEVRNDTFKFGRPSHSDRNF